jgi:hypothetical protein
MNAFIPITSTFTDETGALIALGSAAIDVAGGAEALEPVWQMSISKFAGEASIELVDGQARVRARISEDLAATKVGKRVYRGFSIAVLKGGDGSTRIARIALVDSPDAVTKGTGAEFLKLSRKTFAMNSSPILCATREVSLMVKQARDRRAEELRITKAQQGYEAAAMNPDSVVGSIRAALARPFREDTGLVTLLNTRRA